MNRLALILTVELLLTLGQGSSAQTNSRYNQMAESMVDMMDAFASAYQKRQATGTKPQGQGSWSGNMPWSQTMNPWGSLYGMPLSQGMSPWSMGNPLGMTNPLGMSNPMSMGNPMGMGTPWNTGTMPWSQQIPMMPRFDPQNATPPAYSAGPFDGQGFPEARSALDGQWQSRTGEVLDIQNGRFRIYQGRQNYREGIIEQLSESRITMQDPESGTTRHYEYALQDGKLALRDQAGNLLLYRQIRP